MTKAGGSLDNIINELERVLKPVGFTVEQEDRALAALNGATQGRGATGWQRDQLWFGGFVVDRLYLWPLPACGSPPDYDNAARVARLLIRFWTPWAELGDQQAAMAPPMLWRSYWLALSRITAAIDTSLNRVDEPVLGKGPVSKKTIEAVLHRDEVEHNTRCLISWVDQINLDHEYHRALRAWQEVCLDDRFAWFFIDWLCPWRGRAEWEWQLVRGEELQSTVWSSPPLVQGAGDHRMQASLACPFGRSARRELRPPGLTTSESRARLAFLVGNWFLPRYDLASAAQLAAPIARANKDWLGWLDAKTAWIGPYGVARLWAGTVLGYIVIALPSDTWRLLRALTMTDRWIVGVLLGALPFVVSLLFLSHGIYRATGVPGFWRNAERTGRIMLKGEIFALGLGWLLAFVVSPIHLAAMPDAVPLTHSSFFAVMLIQAQIAIFIGIFTQLLFVENPVTKRLDRP